VPWLTDKIWGDGISHAVTADESRTAEELGRILHATARNEQNERPAEKPLTQTIQ
jgi:hypothetical protein